jgi:hypothetical protein
MRVKILQWDPPGGCCDVGPTPYPLEHGFDESHFYEVHGWILEGSELRAVLVNNDNEIWAVSNRHLLAVPS